MADVKHLPSLSLLVVVFLASCGDSSGSAEKGKGRSKRDRGAASMTLGETQWQADSAKAKLRNGNLTISARNLDMTGGQVKSQDLTLSVPDYNGPGDYTTGFSGSRFIGVGIDVDAAKAASGDERATSEAVTDSLLGASHLMLSKAKVTIVAASDVEISGTFSWQPPQGVVQPAIQGGTFRALLAK
ncbi:MAG: adhesin HecA-like repeat protein [Planctomycetota bacterium]|jgi:adhesin HecA-like repeat protein